LIAGTSNLQGCLASIRSKLDIGTSVQQKTRDGDSTTESGHMQSCVTILVALVKVDTSLDQEIHEDIETEHRCEMKLNRSSVMVYGWHGSGRNLPEYAAVHWHDR
jgi:hypothetical protein